ncbi:MAG: isochorismate synthase [Myroides sp.]
MNDLLVKALSDNLPFVIYRKPNETTRYGWFQREKQLNRVTELTKSCFVFAPFSNDEKVVFYPKECQLIQEDQDFDIDFSGEELSLENSNVDKSFHIQLVSKGIEAIKNGLIEKVVLSRKEEVLIDENSYEIYFKRFLKKYPTAFVYWFYHPEVGVWMGATPEQLVKIEHNKVQTVALAGTQVDLGLDNVIWGKKEIKEQQIVTSFIVDALQPFTKNLHKTEPYTFKAGSLIHIKTDIQAELSNNENGFKIVKALHPTPALCGYPKKTAHDFIVENEGYAREYYGGYLGEWKFNNLDYSENSNLFVNLRCMKIERSKAYLFLGGGVNKDSDPESEYYETVNKSKTVKSIL